MMMVDTINPNTSEPDGFTPPAGSSPAQGAMPNDRFYGGFDKPDDVKINLAASGGDATGFAPSAPVDVPSPASTPNSNNFSDMTPPLPAAAPIESQVHTTYSSKKGPVNTRGVLVIVAIGLVATMVLGGGLFFLMSTSNANNLAKQKAQLDELNQKLIGLNETPEPLKVATTETATETETEATTETTEEDTTTAEETAVEPVVVPDTTESVESTETQVPSKVDDSANAAG